MFGKSSKINEFEAIVEALGDKVQLLETERDLLQKRILKEEERGKRAKKDLQRVEVSLKEAKQRVVTLENELEKFKEVEKEDITFKDTLTLTDQRSLELLHKIGSIKSEKRDLLTIYLMPGEGIADLERSGEIPPLESDIESGWMLADAFNTEPIEESIHRDRVFCIILSHADETFIGVSDRNDFLDYRIIRSGVKEKHTKGGWSQKRFSRLREEDIKNHVKKVADALSKIIDKWGDSIEFIIVGGDYNLIKEPLLSLGKIPIVVRGIDARVGEEREGLEDIRVKAFSLRWYVLG
jgi:hypothetical protein